jgi:hypothetical protein
MSDVDLGSWLVANEEEKASEEATVGDLCEGQHLSADHGVADDVAIAFAVEYGNEMSCSGFIPNAGTGDGGIGQGRRIWFGCEE